MAKNTRSGLGRGLDALLGNSFEEVVPEKKEPTPPTKKEEEQGGAPEQEKEATQQPKVERVIVEGEDVPSESVKAVKVTAERAEEIARETKAREEALRQEALLHEKKNATPQAPEGEAEEKTQKTQREEVVERSTDEVPVELIEPNPDQPRTSFKKGEIEELAASIEKDGLLQPILVRNMPNKRYQIIAGERRWQACKLLGLKTVPVRIKEADDEQALELALVENIQRTDLNPIEEAYGYRRIMERRGMTQAEVAQTVSKGRSTIANALRLLELPEDAQQLLFEEKITAGHARAILSIPTAEGRQKLTEKMVNEKITVREAESIARLYSLDKKKLPKKDPLPASYKNVARELRSTLNAPVHVKTVKGKNRIEIEFVDEDDLKRLFKKLMNDE